MPLQKVLNAQMRDNKEAYGELQDRKRAIVNEETNVKMRLEAAQRG